MLKEVFPVLKSIVEKDASKDGRNKYEVLVNGITNDFIDAAYAVGLEHIEDAKSRRHVIDAYRRQI